ncbi:MAG: hypothetical protein ACOYMG_09685 [Candidatus Methylumidiphilus sp.]
MPTNLDLFHVTADVTGVSKDEIDQIALYLKREGMMPVGVRGRNSPRATVTSLDAARLLLALYIGPPWTQVPSKVRRVGAFRSNELARLQLTDIQLPFPQMFVTGVLFIDFIAHVLDNGDIYFNHVEENAKFICDLANNEGAFRDDPDNLPPPGEELIPNLISTLGIYSDHQHIWGSANLCLDADRYSRAVMTFTAPDAPEYLGSGGLITEKYISDVRLKMIADLFRQ